MKKLIALLRWILSPETINTHRADINRILPKSRLYPEHTAYSGPVYTQHGREIQQ